MGLYQSFISVGLSNCKCVIPARVGPCAIPVCLSDMGCQHSRTQVFPEVGKGDFMAICKSAVQRVKGARVGGQIPAVPVLSDAMSTNREKIILDDRLNTSPLGEEYSTRLSEAWLLGGPNRSSDSGGQGGIKPFYI